MSYLIYFIAILLFNMVLLAFYVMEVFTEHHECKTKNGANVTLRYEFVFKVGLVILLADATNNLINIYLRFKVNLDEPKPEPTRITNWTPGLFMISTVFEWIAVIATLGVSLLQFLLKHSNYGKYCAKQPNGVLVLESKCMSIMIIMQLLKVVSFCVWAVWRSN